MLGLGIARGMLTTLKHILVVKPVTVQYPEQRVQMPTHTRGRPRLIYDVDSGDLRCTACGACAIACPVDVIKIEQHAGPDRKKVLDRFDLDMGGCIECALCVEACPFRAITMAPDFEMATYDRTNSMVFNMHQLRIPGTPEIDGGMEYIQGVKRGLAGQAPRGEAPPSGARATRAAATGPAARSAAQADPSAAVADSPPGAPGAARTARPPAAARPAAPTRPAAPATQAQSAPPSAPQTEAEIVDATAAGQSPTATPAAHPLATPEAAAPEAVDAGVETATPEAPARKEPPRPPAPSGSPPMSATRARLGSGRGPAPAAKPDAGGDAEGQGG